MGLNEEVAKIWATTYKPDDVREALSKVREIGHMVEDHNRQRQAYKAGSNKPSNPNKSNKDKSPLGPKNNDHKVKKPKGKDKSKKDGWKDANVELRGVSQELKKKRKDEGLCMKCGLEKHPWWECPREKPITETKAAAGTKKSKPTESKAAGK
jgi:hypothetical protein